MVLFLRITVVQCICHNTIEFTFQSQYNKIDVYKCQTLDKYFVTR